jgi:hypothetical protein
MLKVSGSCDFFYQEFEVFKRSIFLGDVCIAVTHPGLKHVEVTRPGWNSLLSAIYISGKVHGGHIIGPLSTISDIGA